MWNLDGKFLVFHLNLAVQDAFTILAEPIASIEKANLTNNYEIFITNGSWLVSAFFDVVVISAMNQIWIILFGAFNISKTFTRNGP